ncbi:nitrate- and nitrite sensing domain-containing protein [Streptomyces sp. NPDC057238]|uniref:sensor histidine kinase n=1 Tax=Streptomyces sp. NPDC057238 TaxID=3346060 RepID=UPI0036344D44
MKRQGWSIRRKFTALLLLPLVSLAALCGYAAHLALGNALTLSRVDTIGNHLAAPLGRAVIALQSERRDAVVAATVPDGDPAALTAGRAASDAAIAAFLKEAHDDEVRSAESDSVREGIERAEKSLATLSDIRRGTDTGTSSPDQVMAAYTGINHDIAEALRAMTILPDQDAQEFGQALYTQVPAGDLLSQEDALISATAATPDRRLSATAYRTLVQTIGARRLLSAEVLARLPAAQRKPFLELAAPGGAMAEVTALEDRLIDAGPTARTLPFTIAQWRAAYDAAAKVNGTTALDYIRLVFTLTGPPAHRAFVELAVAGTLSLASLIVSVVMSVRMARSLVGDINRLNTSSRNLTDDRLRDVVGRLRRGETVDVRTGMKSPVFVNREMAELGAAFGALQRTAVDLAQEDVRLHQGINQLFTNLARRSQVLIHRQLSLLDVMERHEEDANTLDRLFELDQLATRMRRYAEGLLIVSGSAPGRFWRRAVPVVDVVRGGIAETEQYARVVVLPVPTVGIQGRAAADVIHLLAELIENAEVFSPSDSEVRVSVGKAASGLVIEIDDRGLGMPPEELDAANRRLGAPLDVTTLDSTRLGLVTVGRLAHRHGIEVTLRRSPYGGVNAVVLIPDALLEWTQPPSAPPAPPAPEALTPTPTGPPAPTRAHAAPVPPAPEALAPTPAGPPERAHAAPAPARPHPSPAPAPAPAQGNMIDGLPVRVPQANLSDEAASSSDTGGRGQLMDWGRTDYERRVGPPAPAAAPAPAPAGTATRGPAGPRPHPGERPDQVRSMMSALQAGAARARVEQYAAPGDPAGRPRGDALGHDAHAAFPAHIPTPTSRKRG